MKTEADARHEVEAFIANAGWRSDQITRESAKYPEQIKRLNNSKPDILLYSNDSRTPMAVVEVKKEGSNLRGAINQAIKYAKKLNCNVVFASDGNIVVSAHLSDEKPLVMQDSEVSYILPEKHLAHFQNSRIWERGEGFADSGDLVQLFNSARKQLNREGIAGVSAFNEFAKIIFVKILTELHDDGGEMFQHVPGKWNDFANLAGKSLTNKYAEVLYSLNKNYNGGFEETKINNPDVLESLIGLVESRSFIDTDADIKGTAYEYFLRDYTKTKDELNRYFTPRHIVKMMVKLSNPQLNEKIYDPFCGTGGMLIESFRHMWRQLPLGAQRSKMLNILQKRSVYGQDISDTAYVAKMNMILAGDGHSNIKKEDSTVCHKKGGYDVVITNIPFSIDGEARFIRCCLDAVRGRENGRATIVVPERIVCENQYSELRKEILSEWNVERVISLPRDIFAEYTNAKTSVLFLSWRGKGKHQKSIPVFKIVHDGFEGKTRRKPSPSTPNDINSMFLGDMPSRKMEISAPHFFFNRAGASAIRARKKYPLVKVGEVISLVERLVHITPGMMCLEPGFESKNHKIFVKKRKSFSQVARSGRKRFAIRHGDLVIGLLHTQNGMIAFSDCEEEMHATMSHRAFAVNEKKVDKNYLFWTLRGILMMMERVDTVGREPFKVDEILALPFPLPSMAEQRKIGLTINKARQKIRDAESALEKSRTDFIEIENKLRSFEVD